jgi:Flp pilus assembly protein TadG
LSYYALIQFLQTAKIMVSSNPASEPSAAMVRRRPPRARNRSGAAVVELALCLPVLLTTALGMIETCNVVFVQARLQSAAFEAARLATRPTTAQAVAASSSQVQAYAQTLLTELGVNGATVSLTPGSWGSGGLDPGVTQVTVSITAPLSQNAATCLVVSNSLTVSTQATMLAE